MEDDTYRDDSYDPAEPALYANAPSEVELCVQKMLGQQLDTDITLEKQVAKRRSFTLAAVTSRPFVEQASGQLSLEDFQALERKHSGLEELRACGLTNEEIALKLEHDECRQMSGVIPPYKHGRFAVDPVVRQTRLKAVAEKIQQKRVSLGISSQEAAPSSHNQTESPDSADDQGGESPGSLRYHATLGKKYVHPDDPINHLDLIAARLFGKSNKDKQDGNVVPRKGNAMSPVGKLTGGCSPGSHDDSCLATEKRRYPNEDSSKEKFIDASQEGLRAGWTLTSDGNSRDSVTKCVETAPYISQIGNLSNTTNRGVSPEGVAKKEISSCGTGSPGTGQKSQSVPGVSEDCSHAQGGDNEPRRLASNVRPLSREDLVQHRLSQDDICKMDRFRNYSPGQPSKVLYLKNLSSKVSEANLASVFIGFQRPDKPKIIFKLLKGRMRGQAFVTFADVEMAADAMGHVNGYLLRGKPVIIQYRKHR